MTLAALTRRTGLVIAAVIGLSGTPATAALVACGGSLNSFLTAMKAEVRRAGLSQDEADRFFRTAALDPKVIRADRGQGIFRRTFTDFSRALISQGRINGGAANLKKHRAVFDRAQREFGVSPGILLAFWAFETDFGAVQGDFNTLNALVTLGHDCRRPGLFQPQIVAAAKLWQRGMFDPARTTGAWAGEIGMVQMLPGDILERGVDGDGDGKVTLKTSAPDALMSAARMLQHHGWRRGEPWLQEVVMPVEFDWSRTGLDHQMTGAEWQRLGVRPRQGSIPGNLRASVLLPEGRKGPAFLAYPNYRVLFEWNKSFVYVTTAAYFATRLEGAPVFLPGNPDPQLSLDQMKSLQQKLRGRGHDVGAVDGILGALTRAAVQKEQARLG
ncbi:MAG TPA: lytic murein transglycosylase, partial [Paracoccaceae bacterium]|nr:lytic murein transglycosylase [Paracoccaceae bacterium]